MNIRNQWASNLNDSQLGEAKLLASSAFLFWIRIPKSGNTIFQIFKLAILVEFYQVLTEYYNGLLAGF